MWTKIENAIENLIKQKVGLQNIQLWSGKFEDILRRPTSYPATRILIEEHNLTPIDTTHSSFVSEFNITCLVFFRSLREQGTGAYPVIESLYKLNQSNIHGYTLTPEGSRLLISEAGEFVFSVRFKAVGVEVLASIEQEPLHKGSIFELEGMP